MWALVLNLLIIDFAILNWFRCEQGRILTINISTIVDNLIATPVEMKLKDNFMLGGKCKELLEAFTVLFSNSTSRAYQVPNQNLKYYTGLLGISISRIESVSLLDLRKAASFREVKDSVFANLSKKFKRENRIDDLVFLEFINSVDYGFKSKSIEGEKYAICAWNDIIERKEGFLYTFGLYQCIVVITSIDDTACIVAHYGYKHIMDMSKNIFLDNIRQRILAYNPQKTRTYIISSFMPKTIQVVEKKLSGTAKDEKFFYHEKPLNVVYNFKIDVNKDPLIYYQDSSILEYTGFYKTGNYMLPISEYRQLEFLSHY